MPCVLTAERDARYVGHVRTFVADLESLARMGVADSGVFFKLSQQPRPDKKIANYITIIPSLQEWTRELTEALQLVASAFDPTLPFPRHVSTDALVVANRAFDLAKRTGVFLGKTWFLFPFLILATLKCQLNTPLSACKTYLSYTDSFDGLVEFALENGAGTLIPFHMLLYVAHLPGPGGVRVAGGGIFSKAASQVCDARDLDKVLPLFLPAAAAAMTREDAVEMGERRLGGNSIAWD